MIAVSTADVMQKCEQVEKDVPEQRAAHRVVRRMLAAGGACSKYAVPTNDGAHASGCFRTQPPDRPCDDRMRRSNHRAT